MTVPLDHTQERRLCCDAGRLETSPEGKGVPVLISLVPGRTAGGSWLRVPVLSDRASGSIMSMASEIASDSIAV